MTDRSKITPTRRRALQWIADHEPVGRFPCNGSAPRLSFVMRLRKEGMVHEIGKEANRGFFGFTLFGLTPAGRRALDAIRTDPDGGAGHA